MFNLAWETSNWTWGLYLFVAKCLQGRLKSIWMPENKNKQLPLSLSKTVIGAWWPFKALLTFRHCFFARRLFNVFPPFQMKCSNWEFSGGNLVAGVAVYRVEWKLLKHNVKRHEKKGEKMEEIAHQHLLVKKKRRTLGCPGFARDNYEAQRPPGGLLWPWRLEESHGAHSLNNSIMRMLFCSLAMSWLTKCETHPSA